MRVGIKIQRMVSIFTPNNFDASIAANVEVFMKLWHLKNVRFN
jgi:hypothetical protein